MLNEKCVNSSELESCHKLKSKILVLLALSISGVVLLSSSIFFSFAIPVQPVTTCLTNQYGTFCSILYFKGDYVVSCPAVPVPLSCHRSPPVWISPIAWFNPFLYFWSIDLGVAGFLLLLFAGVISFWMRIHNRAHTKNYSQIERVEGGQIPRDT